MSTTAPAAPYPIRQSVTDDLARNRATVFFRIILAIPHLIWTALWGIAAVVVAIINWFATLIGGQSPAWAHEFLARFLRYAQHVNAYIQMAAEPYPGFLGEPGYPVDLTIDPPAPQRRVITAFRIILAVPMLIVANVLSSVAQAVAILAWFYCLFVGRMHEGMRNLIAFCLAFQARTFGYVALLTDRYPPFSENPIPTS